MVDSGLFEGLESGLACYPVAFDDGLGVDLLLDKLLSLAQQLGGQDRDGGGTVTDLVILDFGNVDKNFGGGVVEGDGLENSGSVVGD